MTLYTKKKVFGVLYLVIAYVLVALVIGNVLGFQFASIISQTLNQPTTKIVELSDGETVDSNYFPLNYTSYNDLLADEKSFGEAIQAEGAVLLQNANLPLTNAEGMGVTLLGIQSRDDKFAGGGNSSGIAVAPKAPTMLEKFTEAGFRVNETMMQYYTTLSEEAPSSAFSANAVSSIASYSDLGIVFIGRGAVEGKDVPVENLAFSETERDLIDFALANFDNVVVLLNTANPLECGFLAGLDVSVLWIGCAGDTGIGVIPEMLKGNINPSGKLTDTYAYDSESAPAMFNYGDQTLTNLDASTVGNKWVNYVENIYMGYRYYETRYADVVMGTGNAGGYDYSAAVQFPYGYGLSYTTFAYSGFTMEDVGDHFNLSVTITNTGDRAGKEAAGFYMQSPYTDYDIANGVEKSAVQLVGFDKTAELAPGASETLTVQVSKELMKAYDANNAKTYIVDAGEYYFAAGENVHAALNNILAAQGYTAADGMTSDGDAALTATYTQAQFDAETWSYGADGLKITNQFESTDLRYYDDSTVYVTRNDWMGTLPTIKAGDREATQDMIDDLHPHIEEVDMALPTTGADNGMNLIDLMGAGYEDSRWNQMLDQMSAQEMMDLVAIGGYQTLNVASVNKPLALDQDGTSMVNGTMMGGGTMHTHPGEYLQAATWNTDLVQQMGYYISQDCLMTGITGWYAPGVNLHRIPTGGRVPDYYSEDPLMTGIYGAAVSYQAQTNGVVVYAKHFAINDQETNRSTVCTFATEQAVRELYLLPFEMCVTDGEAMGMMTSMNRIGMRYASAHSELLKNVTRGEWGFQGIIITDAALSQSEKIRPREVLLSGTDLFLCTNKGVFEIDNFAGDGLVMNALRDAAHRIMFSYVNSNVMNGLSATTKVISVTPPWQITLIVVDCVVGIAAVAGAVLMARSLIQSSKRKGEEK